MTVDEISPVTRFLNQYFNYEKKTVPITAADFNEFADFIHRKYPDIINDLPVIHIAGSKGKTSITWLLRRVLQKHGYKVGTFTSPHLSSYTERISLNGTPLSEEKLMYYLQKADAESEYSATGNLRTVFELLFIASLHYFADESVDYAIYETGLGGRLDATNVFTRPLLTLLTPIQKDHTRLLGKTLTSIAGEKAGILKKEVPALSFPQRPVVRKVLREKSKEKEAPLTILSPSSLETPSFLEEKLNSLPVNSAHLQNVFFTEKALRLLDIPLNEEHIYSCLLENVPGRWELHYTDNKILIFDGAHCPFSAFNLRKNIDRHFPGQPVSFILSFMKDKNYRQITRNLMKKKDSCYYYPSPLPRALPYSLFRQWFFQEYGQIVKKVSQPLQAGYFSTPLICVTGSFYHLERIKSWLISSKMSTKH